MREVTGTEIWGRDGKAKALEGMAVRGPVLEAMYSFRAVVCAEALYWKLKAVSPCLRTV